MLRREKVDQILFDFLTTIYLFERREEARFGLSWQEVYLLQLLRFKGKQRITVLAESLRIPLFKASRLIDRLEKGGYLSKVTSPQDARVRYADITPLGLDMVKGVEEYNWKTVSTRLDSLDPRELETLASVLPRMRHLLGLDDD